MLRTVRKLAPTLCALSFAVVAPATLAVTLVGCADESQPETWVKRLEDPVKRPSAIKRLVQFFEDAMTRANKNREDASVKALLDKIVEPLSKTYVEGKLDDKTRIDLAKFLADTRDVRAKGAWIKACSEFAKGGEASEDDLRWVAPAIGAAKLEDAAEALGQAFVKLQAGTQKGSQAYKNVSEAMLALKSPSWKTLLLERINRPMEKPAGRGDESKVAAYQNEQFWQVTAAQILGELRDKDAVRPLLKVVMTPSKADVAATASTALMKIGPQAVPTLILAMTGQDADIVDYAKSQSGGSPEQASSYVRTAAVVLGAIGRAEAAAPITTTLEAADSDVNRAVLARELTKLPQTAENEKAFQAAYDKLSPTALIPPGTNARQQLVEAASHFYDASLVPWLLKQVKDAKGGENEKGVVQTAALVSSIKLATKAQLADVKAAVDKEGTQIEKDALALATDVVGKCDEVVACYLAKVQESAAQTEKSQFIGIKAAYMLGVLGNEQTPMAIVQALPKVRNAAVRFSAVAAIDHLVRANGAAVADALQKIVDENKAKDDRDLMQADAPVKEIIHRLRAR